MGSAGTMLHAYPLRLHSSLHCDRGRLTSMPCTITALQECGSGAGATEWQGQASWWAVQADKQVGKGEGRTHWRKLWGNQRSWYPPCMSRSGLRPALGSTAVPRCRSRKQLNHPECPPAIHLFGPWPEARVALDTLLVRLWDAGKLLVGRHALPRIAAAVGDVREGCAAGRGQQAEGASEAVLCTFKQLAIPWQAGPASRNNPGMHPLGSATASSVSSQVRQAAGAAHARGSACRPSSL